MCGEDARPGGISGIISNHLCHFSTIQSSISERGESENVTQAIFFIFEENRSYFRVASFGNSVITSSSSLHFPLNLTGSDRRAANFMRSLINNKLHCKLRKPAPPHFSFYSISLSFPLCLIETYKPLALYFQIMDKGKKRRLRR